jgi:hypothetical protein
MISLVHVIRVAGRPIWYQTVTMRVVIGEWSNANIVLIHSLERAQRDAKVELSTPG